MARSSRLWPAMVFAAFVFAALAHAAEPSRALRVLFIGNSLTYVNDVPGLVEALAEAAGEPAPVCRAVVAGGFSLEDHWNRGEALRAIEQASDARILQEAAREAAGVRPP